MPVVSRKGPGGVPEKILIESVRTAIELGADVNRVNSGGQTAVHGAAGVGFDSIVTLLAERGANLNVKDKRGQSPLDAARARNAVQTVAVLTALGAEAAVRSPANGPTTTPAPPR